MLFANTLPEVPNAFAQARFPVRRAVEDEELTSVELLSVLLEDVVEEVLELGVVSEEEVVELGVLSEEEVVVLGEVSDDVLELAVLSEVELSPVEDVEEGDDAVVEVEGEIEEEGDVELPELEVDGVEPVVLEDPGEDEELDTGDDPVVPEEVPVPKVVELPDMIDDPPPSGH